MNSFLRGKQLRSTGFPCGKGRLEMTAKKQQSKKTLTSKQEQFVEGVLRHGNMTRAAREADYAHPDPQAFETLRNPKVRERIEARREQAMREAQVHTDEIIGTLVSHMRTDVTHLLDENGELDLKGAINAGVSHLIKEVTVKTDALTGAVTSRTVRVHDSQAAARALCGVFGLEQEPRPNAASDARMRDEIEKSLARIMDRAKVERDVAVERLRNELQDDPDLLKYVI